MLEQGVSTDDKIGTGSSEVLARCMLAICSLGNSLENLEALGRRFLDHLIMFSSLIRLADIQILMAEYHRLGHVCFTSKWQVHGVMMTTSHIIATLESAARKEDRALVVKAHAKYGDTFAQHFSYHKGGRKCVYSMPFYIAEHYRKLHSMSDNLPVPAPNYVE